VFRFVIEHFAAYCADKECERYMPFVDHDVGKLLLYEPNLVNATDGRIRVLEFEASFGHWRHPSPSTRNERKRTINPFAYQKRNPQTYPQKTMTGRLNVVKIDHS
jgi:hypothetical protein